MIFYFYLLFNAAVQDLPDRNSILTLWVGQLQINWFELHAEGAQ